MLAEMATRLSAARGLVNRAAFERDSGRDFSQEAAMAKWYASETASFAAREAVQIYGGYGYTKDFPVERYMRDAKVTEIYGDTSATHKVAVAENLLE
jgi:butyryl-CoA dehydrogenase